MTKKEYELINKWINESQSELWEGYNIFRLVILQSKVVELREKIKGLINEHPCKDCSKRQENCHTNCDDYKEYESKRKRTPRNQYNARKKLKDFKGAK